MRTQKKLVSNSVGDSNLMKFYTDESPGIKLSPTHVLILTIGYIGGVILLHIAGKIFGGSSAKVESA